MQNDSGVGQGLSRLSLLDKMMRKAKTKHGVSLCRYGISFEDFVDHFEIGSKTFVKDHQEYPEFLILCDKLDYVRLIANFDRKAKKAA